MPDCAGQEAMDAGVSWPNEASMTCKMDENITNIMALFDATSSGNLI